MLSTRKLNLIHVFHYYQLILQSKFAKLVQRFNSLLNIQLADGNSKQYEGVGMARLSSDQHVLRTRVRRRPRGIHNLIVLNFHSR